MYELEERLSLTDEQMKAVKSVERAMKKAERLGVAFWLQYENLAAYNNKKITQPLPDESAGKYVMNGYGDYDKTEVNPSYDLKVGSMSSNSDDPLYFDER